MANRDWFAVSGVDVYTTPFPIGDDDEIMIENRLFNEELGYFAGQVCGISIPETGPTMEILQKVYNTLVTNSDELTSERQKYATIDIGKREYNPHTHRLVNKCKIEQTRDSQFRCKSITVKSPVESKPVLSKPVLSKPVVPKPVLSKPVLSKPVVPKRMNVTPRLRCVVGTRRNKITNLCVKKI
jgi:hypothetical protein